MISCPNIYTNNGKGNISCKGNYEDDGIRAGKGAVGSWSMSLIMFGIHKCSGACYYCSAAKSMDYRGKGNNNTFILDEEKTLERIKEYLAIMGKDNNRKYGFLQIDIWGGNPVENREPFKKTVKFIEDKLYPMFDRVRVHTSGNGLELQHNGLVQFLIDHDIHYQLSHDGLGQWVRTPGIDPLYWDKTKDNILKLVRHGNLDWINTTLTYRNPSFFANITYWNKWRQENDIMDKDIYIKLNHIYPGTLPIDKVYEGPDNDQIKHGEVIGDLNFRGEVMHAYLEEFKKLSLICCLDDVESKKNKWFAPYHDYIMGQMNRYRVLGPNDSSGMCRDYQQGKIKHNFAIDTSGEYCECNLIDSSSHVLNKNAAQPDYCKDCPYKNQAECNPCGSENFEPFNPETGRCTYRWQWIKTLETMKQFLVYKEQEEKKIRNLNRQITQLKNGNNSCECKKPKD